MQIYLYTALTINFKCNQPKMYDLNAGKETHGVDSYLIPPVL